MGFGMSGVCIQCHSVFNVFTQRLLTSCHVCLRFQGVNCFFQRFCTSMANTPSSTAYWYNTEPILNQYNIEPIWNILRIYWPRYNDCILTSCQYRKVVYSRYLAN